jgi:thiol-disulfide isomerase/thioredoxin
MRVMSCILMLAAVSLGGTGCALFNKKPGDNNRPSGGGSKEPAKFPAGGGGGSNGGGGADPLRGGTSTSPGDYGSLIAGTVIDKYNNRLKEAYVSWVRLDDPNKKNEAPIDVAVSPEGTFTIQGLKSNGQYKLLARAKDGNRMIAGVTFTKAPNIRVLIRLSEENVNADTPPIPAAPAYTKEPAPKKTSARPPSKPPATAQAPGWGNPPPRTDAPKLATPVPIPDPGSAVQTGGWVPGIVDNQTTWPPVGNINPPVKIIGAPIPLPGPGAPFAPTRVPSCVLVGNQLVNMALYDLNHQPWEFKTNRRGKLVLLDFWGTMCLPCRETIPHLRILQSQYGSAGLEVVGIACEQGSFDEQARKVQSVGERLQINYRQLLSGDNCPALKDFHVRAIPTLILLDENGNILWRHEGTLSGYERDELELLIKKRL